MTSHRIAFVPAARAARAVRVPIGLALGLAVTLAGAGCGGGSSTASGTSTPAQAPLSSAPSPTPTAPADQAAASAQIRANWATFFNTHTPQARAIALLQDAASLKAALTIAQQASAKTKAAETARVTGITFVSPTEANVTYVLSANGQPLLNNASGQAVLEGGVWKVSKLTFCSLVALANGGATAPGC
jgi:hypothetical protein